MQYENIKNKSINAAKWSTITEVVAKFISPLTNMILARLLAPEAFGIIATITMIMSFTDMFTDAGFQKYLVQHDFTEKKDLNKYANVAFWTNLMISLILYICIVLFRNPLAILVGNPGLGNVIAVACIQLLLTSFSSIQRSLYRRKFNFRALFIVQLITNLSPFLITIPLAFVGFGYWSLIIGLIVKQLILAVLLTLKSDWKPKLYYNFDIFKKMISFSIWSLIEAISIWLTVWIDAFIIGKIMSMYYLGIFKTSTTMINSMMAVVTSASRPVLYATLSRLKDNEDILKRVFLKIQRLASIILFPIGVGAFIYRDFITNILLGNQWKEASLVVGLWAITSSINIVLGYYCTDYYRAKGLPKLSFLAQLLHLIFLIPAILISIKYSFIIFIITRSLIRLQMVLVHIIFMKNIMKVKFLKTVRSILPSTLASLVMGIAGWQLLLVNNSFLWQLVSIVISSFIYIITLWLFPSVRIDIRYLTRHLIIKLFNKKKNTLTA